MHPLPVSTVGELIYVSKVNIGKRDGGRHAHTAAERTDIAQLDESV